MLDPHLPWSVPLEGPNSDIKQRSHRNIRQPYKFNIETIFLSVVRKALVAQCSELVWGIHHLLQQLVSTENRLSIQMFVESHCSRLKFPIHSRFKINSSI